MRDPPCDYHSYTAPSIPMLLQGGAALCASKNLLLTFFRFNGVNLLRSGSDWGRCEYAAMPLYYRLCYWLVPNRFLICCDFGIPFLLQSLRSQGNALVRHLRCHSNVWRRADYLSSSTSPEVIIPINSEALPGTEGSDQFPIIIPMDGNLSSLKRNFEVPRWTPSVAFFGGTRCLQ